MSAQPEALRLAAALDAYWGAENGHDRERQAAAELRRLSAENAALRKAAEAASCSNTFDCQCLKHFASQQSEQRPKRVLTAVWRDRAQRAEAQRDALLEACRAMLTFIERHAPRGLQPEPGSPVAMARAAIKAVEEGK